MARGDKECKNTAKKWIPSDHLMHIIDWKTGKERQIKSEKEKKETQINNKKRAENINAEEWQEYKEKVREKILKDTKLAK
jgi:hypothetical protein